MILAFARAWFKIVFVLALCVIVIGWPVVGGIVGFKMIHYLQLGENWTLASEIAGCLTGIGLGTVTSIVTGWWMVSIYLKIDEHIHSLEENMND